VRLLGLYLSSQAIEKSLGKYFVNFSPGISNTAAKAIRQTMRGWRLDCRIDKQVDDLARMFNPIIRGLDDVLWAVLQIGIIPDAALSGPASGTLGDGKIQASAAASTAGGALDAADGPPRARALCPLAYAAPGRGWTVRAG
jgi:hypothetical protein